MKISVQIGPNYEIHTKWSHKTLQAPLPLFAGRDCSRSLVHVEVDNLKHFRKQDKPESFRFCSLRIFDRSDRANSKSQETQLLSPIQR